MKGGLEIGSGSAPSTTIKGGLGGLWGCLWGWRLAALQLHLLLPGEWEEAADWLAAVGV